jgi:NAD(P)-dependent dehydrogenase (short-subunit alcohol dehydrogenase family)
MAEWIEGKRVLITGGTGGIGKQAAIQLLQLGAHVVLVGRNEEKTKAVVEELKTRTQNPNVEYLLADLSTIGAVQQLVREVIAKYPRLDVLLNNAGGMNPGRGTTADGYERTLATNHLAYFVLANGLLPLLEKSSPSRIVNVASDAHTRGKLDYDDLNAEKGYSTFKQYSRTKAMNILFTRELAKRVEGKGITVNCLHPGFVASDFMAKPGFWSFIKPIAYLFAIDEVEGAKTSVFLCSSPEVAGVTGKYFVKSKERAPASFCADDDGARRLWELTEKLVAAKSSAKAA